MKTNKNYSSINTKLKNILNKDKVQNKDRIKYRIFIAVETVKLINSTYMTNQMGHVKVSN